MGFVHKEKTKNSKNQNQKVGLINTKGEFLLKPNYDEIKRLHNSFLRVKIDEKYGLVDDNYNFILPAIYDNISDFSNSFILLTKKDELIYFNLHNQKLISPE